MPQRRSMRSQEREVKKELRQKTRQLELLTKQRTDSSDGRKTEEMLRLEQRISHLKSWLANINSS